MRSFSKRILKQTAENLCKGCFAVSVLLVTLTCMISTIAFWQGDQYVSATLLELLFDRSWQEVAMENVELSAEVSLVNYGSSDWFVMLLLLGCAFPSVSGFLAEYRSGNYYMSMGRSTMVRYAITKMAAAALTGMIVFLAGYGLYAGIVWISFPSISGYSVERMELLKLYIGGSLWETLSAKLFDTVMLAALLPVLTMLCAIFINDLYLVFGLPMLLLYFMNKIQLYMILTYPELLSPGKEWWMVLVPTQYNLMYIYFPQITGLPHVCFAGVIIVEIGVLTLLFYYMIKRRRSVHG